MLTGKRCIFKLHNTNYFYIENIVTWPQMVTLVKYLNVVSIYITCHPARLSKLYERATVIKFTARYLHVMYIYRFSLTAI